MMPLGLWLVIGMMLVIVLSGIVFLIWGWESGQFRNIEEAKYRMLEDKDPEPWPDQKRDEP